MVAMTRARTLASGLGNPPLLQRLLDAVTCAFVCLVQGVAATFGMRSWIGKRDWHTHSGTSALPQTKPDIQFKEQSTPEAALEACPSARVPGEGRYPASAHRAPRTRTTLSPLIPTHVGIRGSTCALSHPAASSLHSQANRSWIPAFTWMSGECCRKSA